LTTYDFKNWPKDGWLKEGYYVSYIVDGVTYYEYIIARDLAHWEYPWPSSVAPGVESGPTIPDALEVTAQFNSQTGENQIWQVIFGIKKQVYVYIELPTDIHRHGIPKDPKPGSNNRETSHFTEYMSPFHEPSFLTEHFMMRPSYHQIAFTVYNPQAIDLTPRLNFFINKLITQRIGFVQYGKPTAASPAWDEILDKLTRRVVPSTPLSFEPVRAPAAPPA